MKTFDALKALQKAGREDGHIGASVYIVGGFVRDLLRNKVNDDLDIVATGLPMEYIRKFLSKYGKIKEVVLSKSNDNISVMILLFRGEDDKEAQISLPRKGKLQEYSESYKIKHDVKSRDFKLNSLYLPINYKSKKEVIDMVGGRQDIVNRTISANGSPNERLKESPIRMLRAVSLAARTEYRIEDSLLNSIIRNAPLIKRCPPEAIRIEFNKILLSRRPSKYIKLLHKTGLLQLFAPEIASCYGVRQDKKYHKYDVFTHIIYTCEMCPPTLLLRMAGLLHDIGKPLTRREDREAGRTTFHKHEIVSTKLAKKFLTRLRYDNTFVDEVLHLVGLHMYHYTREWTAGATRKFIKRAKISDEFLSEDKISDFPLFILRMSERKGNGLKEMSITDRQRDFERKLVELYRKSPVTEIKSLDIDGYIIMDKLQLGPGKEIGKILGYLLDRVVEEPELNEREKLLGLAREYIQNQKEMHEE